MRVIPSSFSGRAILALGVFAFCMGIIGLISPTNQISMMGFDTAGSPGSIAIALMSIISFATVNTAILYIVGSIAQWPVFWGFAVLSRFIMGGGLMIIAFLGIGPNAFFGAAAWEWIGAIIICGMRWWDWRCKRS